MILFFLINILYIEFTKKIHHTTKMSSAIADKRLDDINTRLFSLCRRQMLTHAI